MEARDVLKRPVITEKSSEAMAEDKYTFDVDTVLIKHKLKLQLKKFSTLKCKCKHHQLQT